MIDEKEIIKKYKDKEHEAKAKVRGGGEVIGMEVDKDNFLYYVIKNKDKYQVKMAQHTKIYDFDFKIKPRIVEHKID